MPGHKLLAPPGDPTPIFELFRGNYATELLVAAVAQSPVTCGLTVIDNDSTDDSVAWLERHWPDVEVLRQPNRGLASFNHVVERLDSPAVLLLNNDVKLAPDAIGPLIRALDEHPDAIFAAPLCWDFAGETYEGMRTRVRMNRGMIQGLCRVPGHERDMHRPDLTASAGPVLAVDRRKFLALGGYDPLYLPGRIEDLDLGFRGWMAGWRGYYVPESIAYHRGAASFGPTFGAAGCDRLAMRNSLLFAWKNLSGPRLAEHLAWLPARLAHALMTGRVHTLGAFAEAVVRLRATLRARRMQAVGLGDWDRRQDAFFRQFHW